MGRAVQHVLARGRGRAARDARSSGLDTRVRHRRRRRRRHGDSAGPETCQRARRSRGDGCQATENCTNGVDDNCNGLVDCADPACTQAGFACTAAAIPAGWTLVAFSASERAGLPRGVSAPSRPSSATRRAAPDTCGCTCCGTPATCAGTATYNGYPNACSTGAVGVNLGGRQRRMPGRLDEHHVGRLLPALLRVDGRDPAGDLHRRPGRSRARRHRRFTAGATCAAPPMLGGGCTGGVCAPPTGTTFAACISHAGDVACPTFGFTQQTFVSTGNPGWVDKRTCGACPCATSLSCSTVTNVALFSSGNCTGGAVIGINTGCQLADVAARASARTRSPTASPEAPRAGRPARLPGGKRDPRCEHRDHLLPVTRRVRLTSKS